MLQVSFTIVNVQHAIKLQYVKLISHTYFLVKGKLALHGIPQLWVQVIQMYPYTPL
jgi:hypothetical protein